jgi:hypothetical protein
MGLLEIIVIIAILAWAFGGWHGGRGPNPGVYGYGYRTYWGGGGALIVVIVILLIVFGGGLHIGRL